MRMEVRRSEEAALRTRYLPETQMMQSPGGVGRSLQAAEPANENPGGAEQREAAVAGQE